MVSFTLNDKRVSVDAAPNTPLLWVVRDHVGLTGTKYGCGAGLCGACTVHVDGKAVRSCQTQLSDVTDKKVVTIEGLSPNVLASAAEGLGGARGAAMRLLPVRPDHEGRRAARRQSETAHARRSSSTWTATSAAAAPITAFSPRSNARRRRAEP